MMSLTLTYEFLKLNKFDSVSLTLKLVGVTIKKGKKRTRTIHGSSSMAFCNIYYIIRTCKQGYIEKVHYMYIVNVHINEKKVKFSVIFLILFSQGFAKSKSYYYFQASPNLEWVKKMGKLNLFSESIFFQQGKVPPWSSHFFEIMMIWILKWVKTP